MSREQLVQSVRRYAKKYPQEQESCRAYIDFVIRQPDCFLRKLMIGHVTGSAWIINPEKTHCLLVFHKKLKRWLQPGGHADGMENVFLVAKKEAEEETGLLNLHAPTGEIFDLDIHVIPERNQEPAHKHYDLRYLFIADPSEPLQTSEESLDLAWIPFDQLSKMTENNASILRMAEKSPLLP